MPLCLSHSLCSRTEGACIIGFSDKICYHHSIYKEKNYIEKCGFYPVQRILQCGHGVAEPSVRPAVPPAVPEELARCSRIISLLLLPLLPRCPLFVEESSGHGVAELEHEQRPAELGHLIVAKLKPRSRQPLSSFGSFSVRPFVLALRWRWS
jgi:hypothetical protein